MSSGSNVWFATLAAIRNQVTIFGTLAKAVSALARHDLAVRADQRCLDDLVVSRNRELACLQIERQREKVEHVASVERARVGGHGRRKVGNADDLHAIPDDNFAELRALDVATLLD